ncbi:protein takeout-like [Chironomus tepperi]|uniref:protein takeout-like n=1 Tax=Chironomus tepperi TaxID=113505 RepID=UPI00391F8F47
MNFTLILLIIIGFVGKSIEKLPPTIPKCHRYDPNISNCIAKAIVDLKPQFKSGDFGGGYHVPKIEPLYIKDLNFGESQGLKIRIIDANIHGISKFKIEKLRVNMKTLKFEAQISIPKLTTYAKYQMQFNFLGYNLKTSGNYFTEQINTKIIFSSKLNRVLKNGTEVIRADPFQIKYDHGTVTQLKMSNLSNGNKVLEDIINSILINNQEFAANNTHPTLEAYLSRLFTEITNKILESTTYDEMFPL